jgi:hypothetical protein
MSEFGDRLLKLRAAFEADKKQLLECLEHANALLDHALDPATPHDEAERDAAIAEALMERCGMIADGQKPS